MLFEKLSRACFIQIALETIIYYLHKNSIILNYKGRDTRFDNAARFFDFHWPITLILVCFSNLFRIAITFWAFWSAYLIKFPYNNFQILKNLPVCLDVNADSAIIVTCAIVISNRTRGIITHCVHLWRNIILYLNFKLSNKKTALVSHDVVTFCPILWLRNPTSWPCYTVQFFLQLAMQFYSWEM
jgi:hypothetical protein